LIIRRMGRTRRSSEGAIEAESEMALEMVTPMEVEEKEKEKEKESPKAAAAAAEKKEEEEEEKGTEKIKEEEQRKDELTPDPAGNTTTGMTVSTTVSEAASDTDTVSGGEEVLNGDIKDEEDLESELGVGEAMIKSAMEAMESGKKVKKEPYGYFEAKLNRSAVKYNRLPVGPAFAASLELDKHKDQDWLVRDSEGWTWPITFHQEGGFEMIRGWRPVIKDLGLEVGSVMMVFRPNGDEDVIEIRKVDNGLEKEATGQKIGDVTLGELIPDETISSTSGDISVVRHIEYKGTKHMAFLKKLAIGAVRPYGTNPPRLELHQKAGDILKFLSEDMQGGNFHFPCELRYNDKGDHHIVKVTIRKYVVLRWAQPSYKRFYGLKEGDIIKFQKGDGVEISVTTIPGNEAPSKMRAKAGEGGTGRKRKRQTKSASRVLLALQNTNIPSKEKLMQVQEMMRLAKDMVNGKKGVYPDPEIAREFLNASQPIPVATPVAAAQTGTPIATVATVAPLATPGASPFEGSHSQKKARLQPMMQEAFEDIQGFLESQGLERYCGAFWKHEITLKSLATGLLTENHLREMGLPIGPRIEILSVLNELTK